MHIRTPFFLRWLGKKTITLTVGAPYLGTLIAVSKVYLSAGITIEELEEVTVEEALAIMAKNGETITEAVAIAWLNSRWKIKYLAKPLAGYMRWHCTPQEVLTILEMVLLHGGTADFTNTTRSAKLLKMMTLEPKTGQTNEGS